METETKGRRCSDTPNISPYEVVARSVTYDNTKNVYEEKDKTAASTKEHVSELNTEGNFRQDQETQIKDRTVDLKLSARDHNMEQDLVDYEVEEDTIPSGDKRIVRPTTNDKPQPHKISWNEWAGTDTVDARKTEGREHERKGDNLMPDVQRVPVSDSRKRDDRERGPSSRHTRLDAPKHHRESKRGPREIPREDSLVRQSVRDPAARHHNAPIRRGTSSLANSGMPPGMNRGTHIKQPRHLPSGPLEPVHPQRSIHPRMMPPGLGGSGSLHRNAPYAAQQLPCDHRRGMPLRNSGRRSRSPVRRYDRPPRRLSPRIERFPPVPEAALPIHEEWMPHDIQPKSPYGGPIPHDRHPVYRSFPRRNPPLHESDRDGYNPRIDFVPSKPRVAVPASPRRFVLPEKRDPYPRHSGHLSDADYNRIPSNHPRAVKYWSPPREFQRRPISPVRSGGIRRSPVPMPPPLRSHPRDFSPQPRFRRGIDARMRRRDPSGRPDYANPSRDRTNNMRIEPTHMRHVEPLGRRGERRHEPSSPQGRGKRQRTSPSNERYRRETVQYRRTGANSPNENPPNIDDPPSLVMHHSETECAWFYVDPQGNTQGPCTIAQFRSWLKTLAEDPQFEDEYKQFMSVDVWKDGAQTKHLMTELLENNVP